MSNQLELEIRKVNNISYNRRLLWVFIHSVMDHLPGGKEYRYIAAMRGYKNAYEARNKAIERLKSACKRADLSFEAVCAEHKLPSV